MKAERAANRASGARTSAIAVGCACLIWTFGCAARAIEVRQHGEMRAVLGGGASAAHSRIALTEAMKRSGAHGVGALPGLAGEITIADGEAWICRTSGSDLRAEGPTATPAGGAALLTVAYVDHWRDVTLARTLAGDELEDFIADHARRQGIDVDRPFPFLIDGELSDLQAHVINGMCPMKPGVPLTPANQPWRYQAERPIRAKLVGFYAPDAVGRLTHPGTRIHAHVVFELDGRPVTAHVERVAAAGGSILRLPASH